jgi:hypothetical protein
MRFLAIVALCGIAHADMSLPQAPAGERWVAQCSERLDQAQKTAAVMEPLFARARLDGADLWLDETHFASRAPALFEVQVYRTRQVDDREAEGSAGFPATVDRWEGLLDGAQYRARNSVEASIVNHRLERYISRGKMRRLIDEVWKPALDDCLTFAARG